MMGTMAMTTPTMKTATTMMKMARLAAARATETARAGLVRAMAKTRRAARLADLMPALALVVLVLADPVVPVARADQAAPMAMRLALVLAAAAGSASARVSEWAAPPAPRCSSAWPCRSTRTKMASSAVKSWRPSPRACRVVVPAAQVVLVDPAGLMAARAARSDRVVLAALVAPAKGLAAGVLVVAAVQAGMTRMPRVVRAVRTMTTELVVATY